VSSSPAPPARETSLVAKIAVRLGLATVAVALSIGAAELLVRALDPYGVSDSFNAARYRAELLEIVGPPRLYRHHPDRRLELRGFHVTTDELGCRGAAVAHPKPDGVRRMMFLGDSVTFGWGVSDEETFVHLVEEHLSERGSWETINTGHMGYDTVQELGAFDEVAAHYEPDAVVLVYVDNDVVPMAQVLAMGATDPQSDPAVSDEAKHVLRTVERIGRVRPYLPYLSALASFVYVNNSAAAQTGSADHAVELGIDLEEGWRLSSEALLALKSRADAAGIPFVVLDYYRQGFVADFCAEHAVPYGSIAFTPEELEEGIRNSASDAHANPYGHRILADRIVERLDELGVL